MIAGYGGIESTANIKECRPDPETELQSVRKHIRDVDRAKELLHELNSLDIGIENRDNWFESVLGQLEVRLLFMRRREADWLKEIDRE